MNISESHILNSNLTERLIFTCPVRNGQTPSFGSKKDRKAGVFLNIFKKGNDFEKIGYLKNGNLKAGNLKAGDLKI